jgi:hypothetical protein
MSRVPYLPSLQRIANADAIEGNVRSPYHDAFALDRIEQALAEQQAAGARQPATAALERAENMLYAAQVNSKALERVTPHIPQDDSRRSGSSQQAEIALASFKAGVCVSANLTIGQFDSHANNDPDQMKLIPEFPGGHRLPAPPGRGIADSRAARRDRPKRDGPHADLQQRQRQGPLVDRLDHVPRPRHQGEPRHRRDRRKAVPGADRSGGLPSPHHIRRLTRPVAAKDYWERGPVRRHIARSFNAMLIDRREIKVHNSPIQMILSEIGETHSVIVFPEGSRNEEGEIGEFKSGIYYLNKKRPDLEMVPVYLDNMNRILPRGEVLPVPLLSSITFGPPMWLEEGESKDSFLTRAREAVVRLKEMEE